MRAEGERMGQRQGWVKVARGHVRSIGQSQFSGAGRSPVFCLRKANDADLS